VWGCTSEDFLGWGHTVSALLRARLAVLAGAGHGLYQSEARRYTTEIISLAMAAIWICSIRQIRGIG